MKILIPQPSSLTGKGQFIQRIVPELAAIGVEVVYSPKEKHDIYLDLVKFRYGSKAKKIIRLDGCYYNKSSSHLTNNKAMKTEMSKADGAIYQSLWSRYMCDYYLGKCNCRSDVIYNGASYDLFREVDAAESSFKYNFFSASRWRSPKRLKEITNAFLEAAVEDSCLWIAGKPNYKVENKNVIYLGHIGADEMAKYFKLSDAFIHISWLDACPNSVIESLCSGTPVICNNVGGTPELVSGDGIICDIDKSYPMGKIDHSNPPKIDTGVLAKAMNDILLSSYRVGYMEKFDIKHVAQRYKDFFIGVLNE